MSVTPVMLIAPAAVKEERQHRCMGFDGKRLNMQVRLGVSAMAWFQFRNPAAFEKIPRPEHFWRSGT
jgi:hypothetical protein